MGATKVVRRLGDQGMKLVMLVVIIAVTGIGLGLALGYPISRITFEESDAIRLDQARLAGQVDPVLALTAPTDLPLGWAPGDPATAAFGLLGTEFCGEEVELPTALSAEQAAVFTNEADGSLLISQAVRVDQWQSAKEYVEAVETAVGECDEFFRNGVDGTRAKVEITDGMGDPPITDHVARTFVATDGSNVQVWSMMAIGDVITSTLYAGPAGPQQSLMSDLESRILIRTAPASFALGGVGSDATTTTITGDTTQTSIIEGGAADETPGAGEGDGATTTVP